VTIVDKGKLTTTCLAAYPSATPYLQRTRSRANVALRTSHKQPHREIKRECFTRRAGKKLIEMCKDRGLAFGYFVETLGGLSSPRLLYRVYVKDGHRELVRGARFGDLDRRTLRSDLAAVGNDAELDNRAFGVPMSIITPSILIDEMEVRRDNATKENCTVSSACVDHGYEVTLF